MPMMSMASPAIQATSQIPISSPAEDLSFEYKYDILSEKMLNCAVEHVHANTFEIPANRSA
jgi:hypothetical protein